MVSLHSVIDSNRQAIRDLASHHGARNIRVFGSVARGDDHARSDIDLLVDMEPGRSLLDLGGLVMDLRDLLRSDVDVVTKNGLRPAMRERVLREARPL
jgi:predicted nucleotidyltransferase